MNVISPRCCGLDVHAKTIVACRILAGKKTTRTFSTMTDSILELADWLTSGRCTHVAMESTGVYWKPSSASIIVSAMTSDQDQRGPL